MITHPNILITEPEYFTRESIARMRARGTVIVRRMSRKELLGEIGAIHILVVRIETRVDLELISEAKNLHYVVTATTGLNHIDLSALKKRGIPVFSLHGTHSISTAEHALGLLFSTARNIPSAHQHVLEGSWKRWKYMGTELTSKTIGIFGIGRIGTEVAKRAQGLKMNVIAYDPFISKAGIQARWASKVSLSAFLKKSDFITIHAPLTKKTRGIFSIKAFSAMKPGLILINSARGAIIDQHALIRALKRGIIRAAALDVFGEEPLPASNPLRDYAQRHGNLILTPHIAASTFEAVENASNFAADVIEHIYPPA